MNYLIVMPILTEIFEQSYTFPLGIAYVSASLKQTGRRVVTYNLNYKPGTTTAVTAHHNRQFAKGDSRK